MSVGGRAMRLVPPVIVGVAMAMAGEIAAVLLLYSGRGFLRAVAVVLAIQAGSAALGVWTAQSVTETTVVEGVRRRWLFALVCFTAAAVTSGAWAVMGGFADSRLGQGIGLALLGGLPLFAAGSLAGVMVRPGAGLSPDEGSRAPGPAAGVLAGLAAGFLLAGLVVLPAFSPSSVLLGTLVLLSAGALVHAVFVAPGVRVELVEELDTGAGPVRVEDRQDLRTGASGRLLLVNGRVRAAESMHGDPLLDDEREIVRLARNQESPPARILALGGGVGTVPRQLARLTPDGSAVLVEELEEVLELAREHFSAAGDGRVEARVGRPMVAHPAGDRFPLVLLDAEAVASGAPVPRFGADELRSLAERAQDDGVVIIHGLPALEGEALVPLSELVAQARGVFGRVTLVEPERPEREAPGFLAPRTFLVAELSPGAAPGPWVPSL